MTVALHRTLPGLADEPTCGHAADSRTHPGERRHNDSIRTLECPELQLGCSAPDDWGGVAGNPELVRVVPSRD